MQGQYGIKMVVTCNREEVLEALKKNRAEHSQIVKEAVAGYLKKAKEAVKAKWDKLEEGKIVALQFSLRVPVDHTAEYNTVIKMLEMHKNETIDLNADEMRQLVEDRWDWTDTFLSSNSLYSQTAATKALGLRDG